MLGLSLYSQSCKSVRPGYILTQVVNRASPRQGHRVKIDFTGHLESLVRKLTQEIYIRLRIAYHPGLG